MAYTNYLRRTLIVALFLFAVITSLRGAEPEYDLSRVSEAYNTRYFYVGDFADDLSDTLLLVTKKLSASFVVELGRIAKGERTLFVYDNDKELLIVNKRGRMKVGNLSIGIIGSGYSKLSLYFVNGKMKIYIDDRERKVIPFEIDRKKRIGVRISREKGYTCSYFNCYEPIPFKVADYGGTLEEGVVVKNTNVRIGLHNVSEPYSLTFPTGITNNSKRSLRFEYRYENTKKEGKNEMLRGRSEISGVFSNSPKNKWIIEYDLYVPDETVDDESLFECITQIHEGSRHPSVPSFCLKVKGGMLYGNIKGDSIRIDDCRRKKIPSHVVTKPLIYLEKNRWYHVKVYLKEGWRKEDLPLAKVWIDGMLLFESDSPNCYVYSTRSTGEYDYLKFGIYKSDWLRRNVEVKPETKTRVYYFDNFIVKY